MCLQLAAQLGQPLGNAAIGTRGPTHLVRSGDFVPDFQEHLVETMVLMVEVLDQSTAAVRFVHSFIFFRNEWLTFLASETKTTSWAF